MVESIKNRVVPKKIHNPHIHVCGQLSSKSQICIGCPEGEGIVNFPCIPGWIFSGTIIFILKWLWILILLIYYVLKYQMLWQLNMAATDYLSVMAANMLMPWALYITGVIATHRYWTLAYFDFGTAELYLNLEIYYRFVSLNIIFTQEPSQGCRWRGCLHCVLQLCIVLF